MKRLLHHGSGAGTLSVLAPLFMGIAVALACFAAGMNATPAFALERQSGSPAANCALVDSSGVIRPCTAEGVPVDAVWAAYKNEGSPNAVTKLFIAADTEVLPSTFSYKWRDGDGFERTDDPHPLGSSCPVVKEVVFLKDAGGASHCKKISGSTTYGADKELVPSGAFMGLGALQTVTGLEDSPLEEIGDWAFSGTGITSLKVPASLGAVGEGAFSECPSLSEVEGFQNTKVVSMSDMLFSNSGLKKLSVPASLAQIGDAAFFGCGNLADVSGLETSSLAKIGLIAFSKCTSLRTISLPGKLTTIGAYAFSAVDSGDAACTALTTVNIATGAASLQIDTSAFGGCTALSTVTLSQRTYEIDALAFSGCSALRSLTIPASTDRFGASAFAGLAPGSVVWVSTEAQKSLLNSATYVSTNLTKVRLIGESEEENAPASDVPGSVTPSTGTDDSLGEPTSDNVHEGGNSSNEGNSSKVKNPFKVKAKVCKVSYWNAYFAKQKIKASKAFKITKNRGGKVTYKKKSGDKMIAVSKKGVVTVKKGIVPGVHKVKVTVTTAAKGKYAKTKKTVTLKVKVV